ncbi:MAG: hypothetical protein ABI718_00380 [Acidobacteriota bacterium]
MDNSALAAEALAIAEAMSQDIDPVGGGEDRPPDRTGVHLLPPDLRSRFIAFRTTLVQCGINDPVLSRFDSHTVAQPSTIETAAELRALATQLAP